MRFECLRSVDKSFLCEKIAFHRAVKSSFKFKLSSDTKSIWHRKLPETSNAHFHFMMIKSKKAFKPFVYLHSKSPSTMVEINFPFENEISLQFILRFPSPQCTVFLKSCSIFEHICVKISCGSKLTTNIFIIVFSL